MSINIYHQCGHCTNWNIDSFTKDKCGSGLIFSPVHTDYERMKKHDAKIKRPSYFDPQFYLPSSQKQKLASYEFFPETISGGFSTTDFSAHALQAAEECVKFQVENEFKSIVIPTRYIDQMYSDYLARQNTYTIHPFVEVIEQKGLKSVYLTVVMTDHMIKDGGFRVQMLNWITSFPSISGLYLIPDCKRTTKQIQDAEFLTGLLVLVSEMKKVGLDVLVGYLNSENLLLTVVPDVEITFGAFENTRIFSIDKFLENEEERRGPKPRIYLPGLLNWVQFSQARVIRKTLPALWKKIYMVTPEAEKAFTAAAEPTFMQPELYKHHFKCVQQQIDELSKLNAKARGKWLIQKIDSAISAYDEIAEEIEIEKHGNGAHLAAWKKGLNDFLT